MADYVEPKSIVQQEVKITSPAYSNPDMEANVMAPLFVIYDDEFMNALYDGSETSMVLTDTSKIAYGTDPEIGSGNSNLCEIADNLKFYPWVKIISTNNVAYKLPTQEEITDLSLGISSKLSLATPSTNEITIEPAADSRNCMVWDSVLGTWVTTDLPYAFGDLAEAFIIGTGSGAGSEGDPDYFHTGTISLASAKRFIIGNKTTDVKIADSITVGTDSDTLVDAAQTFITSGVKVGDLVDINTNTHASPVWTATKVTNLTETTLVTAGAVTPGSGITEYCVGRITRTITNDRALASSSFDVDSIDNTNPNYIKIEYAGDDNFVVRKIRAGDTIVLEKLDTTWVTFTVATVSLDPTDSTNSIIITTSGDTTSDFTLLKCYIKISDFRDYVKSGDYAYLYKSTLAYIQTPVLSVTKTTVTVIDPGTATYTGRYCVSSFTGTTPAVIDPTDLTFTTLLVNSEYKTIYDWISQLGFDLKVGDSIKIDYYDGTSQTVSIVLVDPINDKIEISDSIELDRVKPISSILYIHKLSSAIYLTARGYETTKMNRVIAIYGPNDIAVKLGARGIAHIANPLAIALSIALQNSKSKVVYGTAVDITDPLGWQKAVNGVFPDKHMYSWGVVGDRYTNPQGEDLKGIFENFVAAKSDPEEAAECKAYLWHQLLDTEQMLYGDPDNPIDCGDPANVHITPSNYMEDTESTQTFTQLGIKVNDNLYLQTYDGVSEYDWQMCPVFAVEDHKLHATIPDISGESLTYTGFYYIERSNDELAKSQEAHDFAAAIKDRRLSAIVAPYAEIVYAGETYYMTGAYFTASGVGHITAKTPGGPLTKLIHNGILAVSGLDTFRRKEHLNLMASGGIFLIEQVPAGPRTRHALTTDMTQVKTQEVNVGVSWDYGARVYRAMLDPYTGTINIDDNFLSAVKVMAQGINNYLVRVKKVWNSVKLVNVHQGVPANGEREDRIYIILDVGSKIPANNFIITFVL